MSAVKDEAFIIKAIQEAVRTEAERIVTEETAEAQKRVTQRLKAYVDQIALSTMSHYEAYTDTRGVHIVVKKEI